MMRSASVLVALTLAIGCGADELTASTNAKTQEVPVAPLGTVSGQVLDVRHAPLAGASVKLMVGLVSQSTTTDDNGQFAFGAVPAGSEAIVAISKEGFGTVRTSVYVPDAAGQFPLADGNARVGPVVLLELTGSLSFVVLDPRGAPAQGATARLSVSPAGIVFLGPAWSKLTSDAVVDAQGKLTFSGVPSTVDLGSIDGGYELWVNPVDVDGDGLTDLRGRALTFTAAEVVNGQAPRTIFLEPAYGNAPLTVEAGNVGSLFGRYASTSNLVGPNEDLRLVFSTPVEAASALVRLTNEDASEELMVTSRLEGSQTLVINPAQDLVVGAEYNLHVRVVSSSGQVFARTGWVFGGQLSTPPAVAVSAARYQESTTVQPWKLSPGEEVFVEFNQVVGPDDGALDSVEVFFNQDINGDFTTGGDAVGEVGNSTGRGFALVPVEPIAPFAATPRDSPPVFPIRKSGLTTRYKFTYGGTNSLDPGLVELVVDFDALRARSTDLYQTAWAVPLQGTFSTGLVGLPPVAP